MENLSRKTNFDKKTEEQPEFLGNSDIARRIRKQAQKAATINDVVLITGESGTGKGIIAELIHEHSDNRSFPFKRISVANLPETIFSTLLFGHSKGSFTSAVADKMGICESVGKGTMVLEDIDNLSIQTQAILLTFLDTSKFTPIGCHKEKPFQGRLIVTTNKNLDDLVEAGEFKNDLYNRLKNIHIHIPPLRKRKEDLEILLKRYFEQYKKAFKVPNALLSEDALDLMKNFEWRGNVREVQNEIKKLLFNFGHDGEVIQVDHLDTEQKILAKWRTRPEEGKSLQAYVEQYERGLIIEALSHCKNVKKDAAKLLGIDRRTLFNKMKRYGLE
jgi:DNA-binding NtrC family response regulator